ncbi:MAG: endo-1,4-beta-xylanase [Planctomycetaceae bacterium]|nr:endo-1,4-beta-xylanase [Planctomycetaceae bacterium]
MKHFICTVLFCCFAGSLSAQENWQSEANARIEKHRKEDVQITVVKNGQPAADAAVEVKMTQNEFLFGCNFFMFDRYQNEKENTVYAERFADIFNFATLGFYWASYEPHQGEPNYAYSEKAARRCKENAIRTKGHPLVWNHSDPDWIKSLPLDDVYKLQLDRTTACAEHFRTEIDTWDVINEVTDWEAKKNAPKLTELGLKTGKPEWVKASFAAARKGNPNATLLINDYVHDERYAALLDKLVVDGKPVFDVIGIQSHLHGGVWDNQHLWETCERFARFGVPLHFTELTILSTGKKNLGWRANENWSDTPGSAEGEQQQEKDVVRIYTMLFSHPSVAAITWWDFSDKGAWMNAPAGLVRNDMSPKPAYTALKKLIKKDWATNAALKTDADGKASVRAFRGEYQISVKLPDGTKKEFTKSVRKGNNVLELTF